MDKLAVVLLVFAILKRFFSKILCFRENVHKLYVFSILFMNVAIFIGDKLLLWVRENDNELFTNSH